ncbi:chromosome partitioning protein [Xylanibacter ruminicola]|nr:chromosome partitioning protein [Xylanibacter ruminicola]
MYNKKSIGDTTMKKNITITFSNQKGGVGKSTLCAMFANYLKEKNAGTVCIMDCDRQHSMVAKRQADAKYLQAESVPYELKSIEIDTLQSAAVLMKSAKAMVGICMFDSPGNIYLQGMVPLLGYSDVIICPFQYEFNCLESTLMFLNVIGKIWLAYMKGRKKPKLIFVPNLVMKSRGTAAEIESWKKTDAALVQAGGIVTPPIYNRADLSRYNTFGNTRQQAEIVRPAFDMIYNELTKLEE